MRVVIQRVRAAAVAVAGETVGKIGPGLLVLAGFEEALHCGSQIGDGLIVEGFEAVQRRLGGHLVCHDFL